MKIGQTICDYVSRALASAAVIAVLATPAYANQAKADRECQLEYLEDRIECLENPGKGLGAGRACKQVAERKYMRCLGTPVEPTLGSAKPVKATHSTGGQKRVKAGTVGEAAPERPLPSIDGMDLVKRREKRRAVRDPYVRRHELPLSKKEPACLGTNNLLIEIDPFAYQSMQFLDRMGKSYLLDAIEDYLTTDAGYATVIPCLRIDCRSKIPSLRITHDGLGGKFETNPAKKGTLVVQGLDGQKRVKSTRRINYSTLLELLESQNTRMLKRVFPSACGGE